jgi:hypothetical protein
LSRKLTIFCFRSQGQEFSTAKDSYISAVKKLDFNAISENASGIMSEPATSEKINNKSVKDVQAGKQEEKMQKAKTKNRSVEKVTNKREKGIRLKETVKVKENVKPNKTKDSKVEKNEQEANKTNENYDQIKNELDQVELSNDEKMISMERVTAKTNKKQEETTLAESKTNKSDKTEIKKLKKAKSKPSKNKKEINSKVSEDIIKNVDTDKTDKVNPTITKSSEDESKSTDSKESEIERNEKEAKTPEDQTAFDGEEKTKDEKTDLVSKNDSPKDDIDGRLENRIPAPWDKDITDEDIKLIPERKQSKDEERRKRRQSKPHVKDKIGKIDINILQKELSKCNARKLSRRKIIIRSNNII